MKEKLTIAIDGWSSCGKSTLAKALAKKLNYIYVDSGAMYRGVTLYALRHGLVDSSHTDKEAIVSKLNEITLRFQRNGKHIPDLTLNGENVESEIRGMEVSQHVSKVAAIKEVRSFLVDQQRAMGEDGGVVMDGRDIGSVVFPNAELKLFVTADVDVRAKRRYDELKAKGDEVSLEEVKENLKYRDHLDTTRDESPLVQTEDAVVIDNSDLTPDEQLEVAYKLVKKRLAS